MWTWDYLEDETQLPVSNYGKHMQSIIQDEDLAKEIHIHLQSLGKKYLHALDVVEYLDKPEVKAWLRLKKMLSECTAQHWMHAMQYKYGKHQNGMYIDGHECTDVIEYWMDIFLPFWESIEGEMMKWDNENIPIFSKGIPAFPHRKRIVLVTHDESTFYENDWRKTCWVHASEKPELVQKGEGASLMVSDFCSPDWGG